VGEILNMEVNIDRLMDTEYKGNNPVYPVFGMYNGWFELACICPTKRDAEELKEII